MTKDPSFSVKDMLQVAKAEAFAEGSAFQEIAVILSRA